MRPRHDHGCAAIAGQHKENRIPSISEIVKILSLSSLVVQVVVRVAEFFSALAGMNSCHSFISSKSNPLIIFIVEQLGLIVWDKSLVW